MKGFKFKLDGLLKVREFKERALKVELGQILKQINEAEDEIIRLKKNIEETYEAQESFLAEPAAGDMIKFFPKFIETKNLAIDNQENLIFALKKKFDQKQNELGKARGEVKVIENLKEKKQTEYKKKLDKKHQENVDELVQIRRLLKESN
jgi:flagellar FliJ protein